MVSAPRLYNEKFQGSNYLLSEVERVQLKKSSIERVIVENSVKFWRWQRRRLR
jgi:hypothetical protein